MEGVGGQKGIKPVVKEEGKEDIAITAATTNTKSILAKVESCSSTSSAASASNPLSPEDRDYSSLNLTPGQLILAKHFKIPPEKIPTDPVKLRRLFETLRTRRRRVGLATSEIKREELLERRRLLYQKGGVSSTSTSSAEKDYSSLCLTPGQLLLAKHFNLGPDEISTDLEERDRFFWALRTRRRREREKEEDPEAYQQKHEEFLAQRRLQAYNQKMKMEKLKKEDPEAYQKILDEKEQKYIEKMGPVAYKDFLEKRRLQCFMRRANMTSEQRKLYNERAKVARFFANEARLAKMTKEEIEAEKQQKREWHKNYYHSLTGEKRERHMANLKKAALKAQQKPGYKAYIAKYLKDKRANETPEQRQKTLLRDRINTAKCTLKKKLQKAGILTMGEIQKEMDKLVERMKAEPLPPLESIREYKPKPRKAKKKVEEIETFVAALDAGPSVAAPAVINSDLDDNDKLKGEEEEEDLELQDNEDGSSRLSPEPSSPAPLFPPSPPHSPVMPLSPIEPETTSATSSSVSIHSDSQPLPLPTLPPSVPAACTSLVMASSSCNPIQNLSNSSEISWKCPKCIESFTVPQDLSKHYVTYHNKTKRKSCQYGENDKAQIKMESSMRKRKRVRKAPSFICMKCPKLTSKSIFKSHADLLKHVKGKHRKFFFPCPKCSLLKYNSTRLENHLKICRTKYV